MSFCLAMDVQAPASASSSKHALAQAAAADLQRPAEPPRRGAEHQYARREQAHALRVDVPRARRPPPRCPPASAARRPLDRLGPEHGPDEPAQRRGAAADGQRERRPRGGATAATAVSASARMAAISARSPGRRVGDGRSASPSRRAASATTPRRRRPSRPRSPSSRRRRRPPRPSPCGRLGQRAGGADEGQPRLLVAVEHARLDAAVAPQCGAAGRRGCARRGSPPWRRPRTARAPARRAAASWPADDRGDLGDPVRRDRAVRAQVAPDPRELALLEHLAHALRPGLGHQHARGVGADVDAGAEHEAARKVAMMRGG